MRRWPVKRGPTYATVSTVRMFRDDQVSSGPSGPTIRMLRVGELAEALWTWVSFWVYVSAAYWVGRDVRPQQCKDRECHSAWLLNRIHVHSSDLATTYEWRTGSWPQARTLQWLATCAGNLASAEAWWSVGGWAHVMRYGPAEVCLFVIPKKILRRGSRAH